MHTDVMAYYADRFDEGARLGRDGAGRLELLRSQELLSAWLPPAPAELLDVGGGPGAYATWLAGLGYRVHLVDPVPLHVEQARAAGSITAEVGDARGLDHPDGSYDAVLLMGPLYHLVERTDRVRALAEARRVVRPGGVVVAAAISRYAAMLDHAALGRLGPDTDARVAAGMNTGRHDPTLGFTVAYLHTVDELRAEFGAAGLPGATIVGVEGPSWPNLRALEVAGVTGPVYDAAFASALDAARLADQHPELTPSSSHLLAVATTPANSNWTEANILGEPSFFRRLLRASRASERRWCRLP